MAKPKVEYATKEDLTNLATQVEDAVSMLGRLVGKLETEAPKAPETPIVQGTAPIRTDTFTGEKILSDAPMPPKWREMTDRILGADYEIKVVYPDSGSGFLFKVIVPLEKSNMSQGHKIFYKKDVRTKALKATEGIDGVERFLEKIAQNLGIKKIK